MRRRHVRLLILGPLLATAILYFMLRWFEHSQVYHPDRNLAAAGSELGRPFEDVTFKASDGVALHGWFFPAGTNSPRRNLAVLLCHGNAGNIGHRLGMCAALLETGAAVFVFDYRGFGRSAGKPGEEGTYLDAQAAHKWLQSKGFAPRTIVAFGESLGGGIASELAVRETIGGLVLESTFSCLADVGAELYPWLPVKRIATIKYDTCGKLPRIKVPVLVMHSRADDLIKFSHGEKNFSLANEPKMFWELHGPHNDPISDQPHFVEGMNKFLALVESSGQAQPGS